MNRNCFFIVFFCSAFFSEAQVITLEGNYQGKNIYVQNPAANSGEGFCTEKVLVNGSEISFINANAYEIKLDSLGYKIDDTLKVEIFHKAGCKPKVIVPHSTPKITFEVVSINMDVNSVLHWIAKNEIGKLTFIIEQFRWNKWVKVGEVEGKGGLQENAYSFLTKPHSGKNKFRVKQVISGKPKASKVVDFEVPDLGIEIIGNPHKLSDLIEFNHETMFELFDNAGNIVRKGQGKKIDLKGLKKGNYYLNYDNRTAEVTKFF